MTNNTLIVDYESATPFLTETKSDVATGQL